MDISFWEILRVVFLGTVAYHLIRRAGQVALKIVMRLSGGSGRDSENTLDELWFRQRDANILLEEIHALLTKRLTPDQLEEVRSLMLRSSATIPASNVHEWEERSLSRNKAWTHDRPSEVETFLDWTGYLQRTQAEREEMSRIAAEKVFAFDGTIICRGVHWQDVDFGHSPATKRLVQTLNALKEDRSGPRSEAEQ